MKRARAVVLLSGGLDSSTVLYAARRKFRCTAVTFSYGQRHRREISCAEHICRRAGCAWIQVPVVIPRLRSSLTDRRITLPAGRKVQGISGGIPSTYVPGRNTIFLSYAAAIAESIGARDIFIGINAVDFSGYPDCRPDYLRAMRRVVRLGTRTGRQGRPIRIHAPLMRMRKAGIIRLGLRLGVPFDETWSCYRGGRKPCGRCDACLLREEGFKEARSK